MNENKIRLARFLALCGVASRRKSEALILEGSIKVNQTVVKDLSFRVSAEDDVELKNHRISPENKIVIALNKPAGYLSTARDDFKRKTVLDLVNLKNNPKDKALSCRKA